MLCSETGGGQQQSSDSTKFKCSNCQTEYTTQELADNCNKQSGCPKYSSVTYKCTNCKTEYSSQALADACDKEYGCPNFKIEEHKDLVYYYLDGAWLRYDKETGDITQAWMQSEFLYESTLDIYIPAASHKETLDSYEITDRRKFNESEDDYDKMLDIINDETTKKCTIEHMDCLPLIQTNLPWKFTEDIKKAFIKKSNPILPEQLKDHNLLYVYLNIEEENDYNVIIVDFTDMKMCDVEHEREENNQIKLGDRVKDVQVCAISGFPDLQTKTLVENPTGYSLVQYPEDDDNEACIELGKVKEGFEEPPKAQVYVDKDGNYFINFAGL